MKKMKKKAWKQRFISFILLLSMMMMSSSTVMADSDKKKEKDYEIQCSTDGAMDENGMLSLKLKVSSNQDDFNGKIRVYVGNSEWSTYASVAYEKPLSIEKGKTKEILFDVGYSYESTGKLWYELVDEDEKVIYEQEDSIYYQQSVLKMKMGVLTDNFSDFSFLNEGESFQMELWGEKVGFEIEGLDETNFPEDENEMAVYDFIFIDKFYTDKLSENQMNALLEWTKDGGMLIMGTGTNAVDTLSGFEDTDFGISYGQDLGVREVELEENAITCYEQSMVGKYLEVKDYSASVSCSDVQIDMSAYAYFDYEVMNLPHVVNEYGSGYAFIYLFSFTDENMSASMKKAILTVSTMGTYSDRVINTLDSQYSYGYNDFYEVKNTLSLLNDIKIPKAGSYLILFGIYMFVATFVTYIVLKKKDKREYVWIAIPAWAVFFTLVIMLVSRSSRVTKPIESSISVIELNGDQKNITSYIGLTTPDTKGYELNFHSDVNQVVPMLESSYYDINSVKDIRKSVDYTLSENSDGFSVKVDNAKVFEYKNLMALNQTGNEEKIDVKIENDGIFYKAIITNQTEYDFSCVIIKLYGSCYNIGELKKGKSKVFSEEDSKDSYYFRYLDDEDYKMNAVIDLCYSSCYGYGSLFKYSTNSDNLVVGIVEEYDIDFIKNDDFKEFNAAIYYQYMSNKELSLREEIIIDDFIYDYTGDYDTYDGEIYSTDVEITYRIKDDVNSDYNVVNRGSRAVDYTTPAKVYFYNVNTEQYEVVFEDSNIVELKNYLTSEGELKAKFTKEGKLNKDTHVYGIPYLYVFGGNENVEN